MSTPIWTFWNRIFFSSGFVWTRRDLKSLGRNFENNAVSVTGLPGFVRKEGHRFRVQKVCILKKYSDSCGRGFKCTWFWSVKPAHSVFPSEKRLPSFRTRLSIGESTIYGKTTSPCQLIFWAIGWLIWINETRKKKSNKFPAINITSWNLERGLRSTWRILWRKKVSVS